MAARRRRRRREYQTTGPMADMQAALSALVQKFGRETLGFAVFALGGYLGYNLFAFGPDSWCALLAGRMAWPLALSFLITGGVMMLGPAGRATGIPRRSLAESYCFFLWRHGTISTAARLSSGRGRALAFQGV